MNPHRANLSILARLAAYFGVQIAVAAVYAGMIRKAGARPDYIEALRAILKENELLEWSQNGILAATLLLCLPALRPGGALTGRVLACIAAAALGRELDSWMRDAVFDQSHYILMAAAAAGLAAVLFGARRTLASEFAAFISRPGFWIMLTGTTLVVVEAQIFGAREIWDLLANPELQSEAKRYVEEGLELMGYVWIFCGVVEERFFACRATTPCADASERAGA